MLLVGYFEELNSERAIIWRVADSMSLRAFLDLDPEETHSNHSTLSRSQRRIDVETHGEVFTWMLQQLAQAGLVQRKTSGIDATTLEANAAMCSLVRRDTGEDYETFVRGLAEASGVETPTREELVRFDRKRKTKTSNREWVNPHDPDARITKLKDGRTRLCHKVEKAVDLETGAAGATVAVAAERVGGAAVRAQAHHGRTASDLCPGLRQRAQAIADPRVWFQPGTADAPSDGDRYVPESAGPRPGVSFFAFWREMGRWIGRNRLWERFWASIGLDSLFGASRTHQ